MRNRQRLNLEDAFRTRVPLWSLFLILLVGSSSGIASFAVLSQFAAETAAAHAPDFTIAAVPVSQGIAQGQLATFIIDLTSLEGFAGSVTLTASMSPIPQNSSIALNPPTVSLFTGQTTSRLTVSTGSATSIGSYTLVITGTSGQIVHSVTTFLSVTTPPPPDFTLSASPSSLNITRGSSGFSTILLTSQNGFQGTVTLTATVTPVVSNGPTVSLSPVQVTLSSGGTQGSSLVISTGASTPLLTYTILVVGTSGSVSHSLAIALRVQ